MKVSINHALNEIISKEYVSLEYVIDEVLPLLDKNKNQKIPVFNVEGEDDEVDLPEDLIEKSHNYFSSEWSDGKMVTYMLCLGYILGV